MKSLPTERAGRVRLRPCAARSRRAWPLWQHPVNRDRLYDFYSRRPSTSARSRIRPHLLPAFPGLDGGKLGHWGNQNEEVWKDDRWNQTDLGTLLCGVFHGPGGLVVPKGRLRAARRARRAGRLLQSRDADLRGRVAQAASSSSRQCATASWTACGPPARCCRKPAGQKPDQPFVYRGFYRSGPRVVFAYRLGDVEMLDAPWVKDGKFERIVAPGDRASAARRPQRRPGAVAAGAANDRRTRPRPAVRGRYDPAAVRQSVEGPAVLRRSRFPARRLGAALHDARRRLARHRPRRDLNERALAAVRLGPAPAARAGRVGRANLRPRPRPDHAAARPERRRRGRLLRVLLEQACSPRPPATTSSAAWPATSKAASTPPPASRG